MQQQSQWLDRLAVYIISISETSDKAPSPGAWLDQTALDLALRFGKNCGVAIIHAVAGPPESPWSNSIHAIHSGSPQDSAESRSRYVAAIVSCKTIPEDYLFSQPGRQPSCWLRGEPCPRASLQEMSNRLAGQYGISAFIHSVSATFNEEGQVTGALILDAWASDDEPYEIFPPKPVFMNINRAITAFLVRIERRQAQHKDSPIDCLTPAQRRVAQLLLEGLSEKQAALHLNRSQHTIHQHVKAIYSSIGIRSRAEFMARCLPEMNATSRPRQIHFARNPLTFEDAQHNLLSCTKRSVANNRQQSMLS